MTSRYEEIMKTKPYHPFRMGYLTDAMVAKAEKELGETDASKAETIPQLKKLIKDAIPAYSKDDLVLMSSELTRVHAVATPKLFYPDFSEEQKDELQLSLAEKKLVCPTDDAYLLQYLRARKFNPKKAFSLMQNYHQVKKSYSDIYDTYDTEVIDRVLASKAGFFLPYRDEDGCAVLILRMGRWDTDAFSVSEAVSVLTLIVLYAVEDPATEVCGVRIILDVQGASLKQVRCLTPRYITLFSRALRNCLAARFKGIHIYNESTIFQYIWSVLKLLLSEKIKNRVHFHGDNQKQLHKFIPKAILPAEDYGGDNPGDVAAWFNTEVKSYYERYAELTTYGYRN